MDLGYDKPLYLLAFDHRGSFEKDLFHATPPISDEVRAGISDAKALIFEGFEQAVSRGAPRNCAGVLVDEEFGAAVARQAKAGGHVLAMPAERSGQAEFELQYGDDFASHIEAFDPTFTKVLVRYNPEGDAALNARQASAVGAAERLAARAGASFPLRIARCPPPPEQLERCGGDQHRYDDEIRPGPRRRSDPRPAGAGRRAGHLEDRGPRQRRRLRPRRRTGTGRRSRQGRLHRARARGDRGAPAGLVAHRGSGARFRRLRRGQDDLGSGAPGVSRRPCDPRPDGDDDRRSLPRERRRLRRLDPTARPRSDMAPSPIRLLLADVDGTLVTEDKILTERAKAAVRKARRGRHPFRDHERAAAPRNGDARSSLCGSPPRSPPSTAGCSHGPI